MIQKSEKQEKQRKARKITKKSGGSEDQEGNAAKPKSKPCYVIIYFLPGRKTHRTKFFR